MSLPQNALALLWFSFGPQVNISGTIRILASDIARFNGEPTIFHDSTKHIQKRTMDKFVLYTTFKNSQKGMSENSDPHSIPCSITLFPRKVAIYWRCIHFQTLPDLTRPPRSLRPNVVDPPDLEVMIQLQHIAH